VNSKEGNSCPNYVKEFGPRKMFTGTLYKAVETSFVDPDYKNPDLKPNPG